MTTNDIINNIINDKLSKTEIIEMYKFSSYKFKVKIKKVIIIKRLYKIYQQKLDNEKNSFIALLLHNMQNMITDKKIYNTNKRLIYKIFKTTKDNYKKIYKEMFKLKPLEEQLNITQKYKEKIKLKFLNMSSLEKKQLRENKKNHIIKKLGYEGYKQLIKNRFDKWYNSLSEERKKEIKNNRNLRYKNLPDNKKQQLLERHKKYYYNLSNEKKEKYKQNKKNKCLI